jgi:hypothetical protein
VSRARSWLQKVLVFASCFCLSGPTSAWQAVDGQNLVSTPKGRMVLRPPAGWMCESGKDRMHLTRDGELLNRITVSLRPHDKAFEKPDKADSTPDMPPAALADLYLLEFKQQAGIRDIEVLAIELTALAGVPAFRAFLTFRIDDSLGGALYQKLAIGAATQYGVLLADFAAPRLNFFLKSVPAFEAMLPTIELLPQLRNGPGNSHACAVYPGEREAGS